jgi:hypothetical protein
MGQTGIPYCSMGTYAPRTVQPLDSAGGGLPYTVLSILHYIACMPLYCCTACSCWHRSSLATAFMRSSTAVTTAEHLAIALLCARTLRSCECCNLLHMTLHKHY